MFCQLTIISPVYTFKLGDAVSKARAALLFTWVDGVSSSVFRCTSTPICHGSVTRYRSETECGLARANLLHGVLVGGFQ